MGKRKYAIFMGDKSDIEGGTPWVVADLGTRVVLAVVEAYALEDAVNVTLRTRKAPVQFWLEDYKWYYEVMYWVEVTQLSFPR